MPAPRSAIFAFVNNCGCCCKVAALNSCLFQCFYSNNLLFAGFKKVCRKYKVFKILRYNCVHYNSIGKYPQ